MQLDYWPGSQASPTKPTGQQQSEFCGILMEFQFTELSSNERRQETVWATPMLIGQATEKIGSQHLVTYSRLQVDLYRGGAKSRTLWLFQLQKAEYVALSSATQESVWMGRLNSELGNPPKGPVVILEDNQSTIAMARNPQFHGRTKHIDIRHHFVRERVGNGTIVLRAGIVLPKRWWPTC